MDKGTINRYFFILPKSTNNYPTISGGGYKQKTPGDWDLMFECSIHPLLNEI